MTTDEKKLLSRAPVDLTLHEILCLQGLAANLSDENSLLRSALTKLADQGYWARRTKESWLRVVMDEYVDFAKETLDSLKTPRSET